MDLTYYAAGVKMPFIFARGGRVAWRGHHEFLTFHVARGIASLGTIDHTA